MKSILFVVGAVSIFFGNVKVYGILDKSFNQVFNGNNLIFRFKQATCDIGLIDDDTNADVFHRPSPKTRSGKCLYECMLRVANMVSVKIIL